MTKKMEVFRWQFESILDLLMTSDSLDFDTIWKFLDEHYPIKKIPQKGGPDIPVVHVFYGYKQDATRYRLENNIAPNDMVIARDWEKLVGLRARPHVINQGGEWSKNNWNHEFSVRTRSLVLQLEAVYGSA